MKPCKFLLLMLCIGLAFGCSKNNEDMWEDPNGIKVQVVLTGGSAESIKLIPLDKDNYYYEILVVFEQNVSKISTSVSSLTDHVNLIIKGKQKDYTGYILINGIKKEFTVSNWDYDATYYISDFK